MGPRRVMVWRQAANNKTINKSINILYDEVWKRGGEKRDFIRTPVGIHLVEKVKDTHHQKILSIYVYFLINVSVG